MAQALRLLDGSDEIVLDVDDDVTFAADDLPGGLGWTLEPEGLCRDDVCVPVRDRSLVEPCAGRVSLAGVAAALDRPLVIDLESGLAAIGPSRASRRQALSGGPLPELTLPTVDGEPVDLASLHGKKVVVTAFATWCGCRDDLPGWQELQDDLGDDVTVIAVALDEDPEEVRPFADKVRMPVLVDREHLMSDRLGLSNVPATVWIDERGHVARPPTVAFGTDTWTDFHGVRSAPHLDAIRAWVQSGEVPEARPNQAAPDDLTEDEESARLWFRIAAHLRRQNRVEEAKDRFARATDLAPLDFTVARAAMPLTDRDPFGPDFLALYDRWQSAGAPFHGLHPDT
jgi:peroxiredoxin